MPGLETLFENGRLHAPLRNSLSISWGTRQEFESVLPKSEQGKGLPEFEDFKELGGDMGFGIYIDFSRQEGTPIFYALIDRAWNSFVSHIENIDMHNKLETESTKLRKELEKNYRKQGPEMAMIEFNTLWPELEAEILSDTLHAERKRILSEFDDITTATTGFFERTRRGIKVKRTSENDLLWAAFGAYLASQFRKKMQVHIDRGIDKTHNLSLFKYNFAYPIFSQLFEKAKDSIPDLQSSTFYSEPNFALVEQRLGKKIILNAATYKSGLGIEDYRKIRTRVFSAASNMASVGRLGDFGKILERDSNEERETIEKIIREVSSDRALELLGNDPRFAEFALSMPEVLKKLKSELGTSKIDPYINSYIHFAKQVKRADLLNLVYGKIIDVDDERDWESQLKRREEYLKGNLFILGSSSTKPKNRRVRASILTADMRDSRKIREELVARKGKDQGEEDFKTLQYEFHLRPKDGTDCSLFHDIKFGAKEYPQAGDERLFFQIGDYSATASLITAVDFLRKLNEHAPRYERNIPIQIKFGLGLYLGLVDEDGMELSSQPIQRARELNQHKVQIKTPRSLEDFTNTGILIGSSDSNNPENIFLKLWKEVEQLRQLAEQGDEAKIQASMAGHPGLYQRIKDKLQGDIELSCRGENIELIPSTLDNVADPHGLVCQIYKQFEDIDAYPKKLSQNDKGAALDLMVELCRKMPTFHTDLISQYPIIRLGEYYDAKAGKPAGYSVYYLPVTEKELDKFAMDFYVKNIRSVLGVS